MIRRTELCKGFHFVFPKREEAKACLLHLRELNVTPSALSERLLVALRFWNFSNLAD
jgi:hypothetical protein